MYYKAFLLSFIIVNFSKPLFSQEKGSREEMFMQMKKFVVAIGDIKSDTQIINGRIEIQKRFNLIGSGLATYHRVNNSFYSTFIVTAKHILNYFIENNLDSVYIRPSWADTLKITDYFGIKVPRINSTGLPNFYCHPDTRIDLGCILVPKVYVDSTAEKKFMKDGQQVFPLNRITNPKLGDMVWVVGYPLHVQNFISKNFDYTISTFKLGTVVWKPTANMNNPELSHITLIESNATYGNSGSPIFSENDGGDLIGIQVSILNEYSPILLNGKTVMDSASRKDFYTSVRSGIAIIESAGKIIELLEFADREVSKFINKEIKQ